MKKFVLIDGNSLIHRGFHAIPMTFRTSSGELTNAVYGFTTVFFGVIEVEKPDHIIICMDKKRKTFRNEIYSEYKATRVKAPQELYDQFARIREILGAFNMPVIDKDGYEADDLLGTLAEQLKGDKNNQTIIVTGDKDALQLVDDGVEVVTPISGYKKVKRYNAMAVQEKMGIRPDQVVDYKALRGDPGDNIPGVMGIGDKGAVRLLNEFETLAGIYEQLNNVAPAGVKEKLTNDKERAFLSQELARIVRDVDIDFDISKCPGVADIDTADALAIFEALEFRSLIPRLHRLGKHWGEKKIEDASKENQMSMF